MRQTSTDTVDKAVCTEESGAARLEAVLVALVERKARALHAEHARRARTHPLLLLLRNHVPDEEASIVGSPDGALPSHWCEHEVARHQRRKLKLKSHHGGDLNSPEELELERRRRRRRRRRHEAEAAHQRMKHRTLLVSAIDEQAKVIHVLDPDELPRRARYTIMVTACLLLFLCLLLVGVTLRMAPLIDDMGNSILNNQGLSRQSSPIPADTPSTSQAAEPATQDKHEVTDPDLDSEILALLGDAPKSDTKFGKPTHKDLASRWQEILEKGLPKEVKEKLMTEYLIPENCDLLVAPSLNPEVKVALADNMVKRDASLVAKQKQLSVAIAAINQAIELIISKESHTKILKPISDACRLLCDSHCTDTKTRRGFVISSINPELKETLMEAKRDSLLFGDNIADKLKSAKSIKKSAADLKQTRQNDKAHIFNKNNFIKHNKTFNSRLNWKTMPRKITPKTDMSQTTSKNQRPQTRSQQRGQRETSERSSVAAAASNRRR